MKILAATLILTAFFGTCDTQAQPVFHPGSGSIQSLAGITQITTVPAPRPQREINYNWEALTSSWLFSDTTLYTYNDSGNILQSVRKDDSNA